MNIAKDYIILNLSFSWILQGQYILQVQCCILDFYSEDVKSDICFNPSPVESGVIDCLMFKVQYIS